MLLWICAGYVLCQTRPGAIIHALGKVKITDDVITLRYNVRALADIPPGIDKVKTKLLSARSTLIGEDEHEQNLFSHISEVILNVNHVLEEYGGKTSSRRRRRGLFDAAGMLSKALFGTATVNDVNVVNKQVSVLSGLTTRNTQMV